MALPLSTSSSAAGSSLAGPVLFFDGECGLCNRVVRLLLRFDRRGHLHFAPLQGSTAQAYLKAHGLPTEDFDSLVFVPAWEKREQQDYLLRTDGVLAALRQTNGIGRALAGIGRLFPRNWRDAAYRLVARWRYKLFGEWKPTPLPRAEWAARFLP